VSTWTARAFQTCLLRLALVPPTVPARACAHKSSHCSAPLGSPTAPAQTGGRARPRAKGFTKAPHSKFHASSHGDHPVPRYTNVAMQTPKLRRYPISPYVTDFFPPSFGGVKKFTEQSLRYATPHAKAVAMVNHVESLLPPDVSYNVLDVCAGIGCNSMAFLQSTRVRHVVAIEADGGVAERLRHNLTVANTGKATVRVCLSTPSVLDLVTIVSASTTPWVVFMDPPWCAPDATQFVDPLTYSLNQPHDTVAAAVAALVVQQSVGLVCVKVPKVVYTPPAAVAALSVHRFTALKKMDLLCYHQ